MENIDFKRIQRMQEKSLMSREGLSSSEALAHWHDDLISYIFLTNINECHYFSLIAVYALRGTVKLIETPHKWLFSELIPVKL